MANISLSLCIRSLASFNVDGRVVREARVLHRLPEYREASESKYMIRSNRWWGEK